jgi:hypothetical protein
MVHQYPKQLDRLVGRLAPFPVIVHLNARVDQAPFEDAVAGRANITFLPSDQRVKVNWAGLSFVHGLQNLLRAAVECTSPDDHIVVLSGTDYPLHPIEDFAQYLRDAPFRQHIKYFDTALSDGHHRRFVERRHYRDVAPFPTARRGSLLANVNEGTKSLLSQAMRWYPPRPCPHGLRPMHGSPWSALTAGCVQDLLDLTTPAFDRWMARTFCPDEMYLHTLIEASPHAASTTYGGPIAYPGLSPSSMANIHLIDDSLDKFYTLKDLPQIDGSAKWFVRKVAPPGSDDLLDRLDDRVSRTWTGPTFAKPVWTYVTLVMRRGVDDEMWTVADVEGSVDDLVAVGSRLARVEMLTILGKAGYEAFGVRSSAGAARPTEETYYLKRKVKERADRADARLRPAPFPAVVAD